MNTRDLIRGLVATLVSLLGFLVLLEITLQVYTRIAIYYDVEMSRYATEVKLKSDNPKIGHVHRPNVQRTLMGVDVTINSDGLRDREYDVARNDSFRMAILGDSLTFGWGVEIEDSFQAILEADIGRHTPVELINFGTGNYNTEQQVNLFLEKGVKYSPDKVVVFYFINDAEPTPTRSRWSSLARIRGLTFIWSRVNSLLTRLDSEYTFESFYSSLYEEDQPGWQSTKAAFIELKEFTSANGIDLQVVMLPELHDLVNYPFSDVYAKVVNFLQENGIEVLDLTPFFLGIEDAKDLWVAPDDAHPNERAHRMIADYSRPFIEKRIAENE